MRTPTNNGVYDVVIIGAGPAGLTAAKTLADNNKKVLVIEKGEIVGDKVCAGGLTLKDFNELRLPEFLIEQEFTDINLYIKNRVINLKLDTPWIWTCDRKKLGSWQLDEALKSGTDVWLDTRIIKIQKNSISLHNGKNLKFKYLIGADGTNSLVRKFLGLKTKKIMLAIQYLVPKEKFSKLEIFFDLKRFGPAYAWIFPHKDFHSVGCGADPKFIDGEKLKQNFNDWCKEIRLNPSEYKLQVAPINYDYQGIKFDNIFLIGDAAGTASGLTGEGMHPAMISGQEVAKKIVYPDYDLPKLKEIIKVKKLEEKILTLYKNNKTITKLLFNFGGLLLTRKFAKEKLVKFLTEK